MKNRIEYLDGHRGLAILLVIGFHAYARWPSLVPYTDHYANVPLFKFGWVGVELFFLVSGFVILMTLEKCASAGEFMWRRWLRLFPAMFVCSLLIFFTSGFFAGRPDGAPSAVSLLPGMTFIEPSWWQSVLGLPVKPLEGGFWSLYVEFKFYIFAAVIYFWKGRTWLIVALAGAFAVATFGKFANDYWGGGALAWANNLCRNLSFEYFGWFAAGAAFYVYSTGREYKWLMTATALTILCSSFVRTFDWQASAVAGLVSLLFAGSLVSPLIRRILQHRFFLFFGFISYPLYLFQENLMIAMLAKLGDANLELPAYLYPVFPVALLSAAAYLVARHIEPAFKKAILSVVVKSPIQRTASHGVAPGTQHVNETTETQLALTACSTGLRTAQNGQRLAILLCTYQGERFLAQQLDSIKAQTFTDWTLWASDDRSTDGTVAILECYRRAWGSERLVIKAGPAGGFRRNFLSLACETSIQADYFAFADQDDLWDADKLEIAIRWLDSIPSTTPALYCARTRLIDVNDRPVGYSPFFPKPFVFGNALAQSGAGGNTMVFNTAARALLVEAGAEVVVQTHDWWAYILVTGCGGKVFYDPTPKVGYRQHGKNLVGSNASWMGRLRRVRRILLGHFKTMNDRNIDALQRMRHRLSPQSVRVLDEFARARADRFVPRIIGIRRSGIYCQTAVSNLALIGAVLLKKL